MLAALFCVALLPSICLTSSLDDVLRQITVLRKSIETNTTQHLASQQGEILSLVDTVGHALKRVDVLEHGLSAAGTRISSLEEELLSTRSNLTAELRRVEAEASDMKEEMGQVTSQLEEANSNIAEVGDKVSTLAILLNVTVSDVRRAEEDIANTTGRVSEMSGTLDTMFGAMTSLRQELNTTRSRVGSLSSGLDRVIEEVTTLDQEMEGVVRVDDEGTIPRDLLPGSLASYSLEDIQWQTLHMSAAAACAAVDALVGSEKRVIPATPGESCSSTCRRVASYWMCGGVVKVGGNFRHISYKSVAGYYQRGSCYQKEGRPENYENFWDWDEIIKPSSESDLTVISYCCCSNH